MLFRSPPPAELQKRPQDGISWVQKVAMVEIGFRGAPGCFWGIWIYIGGRRKRGLRPMSNSDQRGGACLLPFGLSPLFPYGPIRPIYVGERSRNSKFSYVSPRSIYGETSNEGRRVHLHTLVDH